MKEHSDIKSHACKELKGKHHGFKKKEAKYKKLQSSAKE